ncbi:MAG: hypothetical protein ACYDGS_00680 [Thermoleophilia bacterium]
MKLPNYNSLASDDKKKQTRKKKFLAKIVRIVPWALLTNAAF